MAEHNDPSRSIDPHRSSRRQVNFSDATTSNPAHTRRPKRRLRDHLTDRLKAAFSYEAEQSRIPQDTLDMLSHFRSCESLKIPQDGPLHQLLDRSKVADLMWGRNFYVSPGRPTRDGRKTLRIDTTRTDRPTDTSSKWLAPWVSLGTQTVDTGESPTTEIDLEQAIWPELVDLDWALFGGARAKFEDYVRAGGDPTSLCVAFQPFKVESDEGGFTAMEAFGDGRHRREADMITLEKDGDGLASLHTAKLGKSRVTLFFGRNDEGLHQYPMTDGTKAAIDMRLHPCALSRQGEEHFSECQIRTQLGSALSLISRTDCEEMYTGILTVHTN